jgi:hypothetical protein
LDRRPASIRAEALSSHGFAGRDDFWNLMVAIDLILISEPAIMTRFLEDILPHLSLEMNFDLLKMIYTKDFVLWAVHDFMNVLYWTLNKENCAIDAPDVEELWEYFFRYEEELLADLLPSIDLGSETAILRSCF